MNILLVYPKYPDTFWSFKHALRFVSKKATFPPLGLLTVASILPKNWNKKLIDMNVGKLTDKQINWADMVFIGGMIVQKESAAKVAERSKALGKVVVAGGPLFTTGKFKNIDHFVLNEAEVTLPLFLEDLKEGNLKETYTSKERPDITKTPLPSWSLINIKDYFSMPIQYSRGCPFNCEFCDIIIMNGRVPRTKDPEQMIREVQSVYDSGFRGPLFIVDDNFIGNKGDVKKMLPLLIGWQKKHRYPFFFTTESSIDLALDEELMQMMADANFNKVFVGIETPDEGSLKECGKIQNTKVNLDEAVKIIHQHGMQVMGGFIMGFDNDKETIFETQIRFIQQTGVVTAMVGLLNAIPQTRLWERLKQENRLSGQTSGENTDGSINFLPTMGKKKLIEGYRRVITSIYSPEEYYKRINTFVKDYKPILKWRPSIQHIPYLNAFIKSIWHIGLLSRSRSMYWKLLIKTGFTKTRALPTVVELAINREHFWRVARDVTNPP
ncbi:B12-binding domain-containing radical SAM protein [Candidatus Woesearchaeota archaeon]|nr:B12-binding domain-containing radical SAM protein [Candidatus Woesearchaeota archaeon]